MNIEVLEIYHDLCYNITILMKVGVTMIKSRLKVLLAEHDMTQKDLAEKTGIRPSTISDICNSKMKHIPVNILNDLCEIFSCQVGDIFQYIDNEKS